MLVACSRGWIAALFVTSACYAPHAPLSSEDDGADSDDGGSTGGTATSTPTSSLDASTASSDASSSNDGSETAADLPPELSFFTVNGSETPSEVLSAGLVEIQVAVTDDAGVDLVEFYDGDTLIASFNDPPYHSQFLVTSAENGGHSYTAVAYDTAGQTAEAGPLPLSISIDGGAIVQQQNVGFDAWTPTYRNPPRVLLRDDSLMLVAASQYSGAGFTRVRIAVASYSMGLSQLWEAYLPVAPNAGSPHHVPWGHAGFDAQGELLLSAQVGATTSDQPTSVFRLPRDGGVITSELSLGAPASGGLAIAPDSGVVVATGQAEITKFDASLSDIAWTTDVGVGLGTDPVVVRISVDSTGACLLDGYRNDQDTSFLRKLSADGDVVWTREADEVGAAVPPYAWSAVAPDDGVTQVVGRSADGSQGIRMITYDTDGAVSFDLVIADGSSLGPHDVAYDPTGRLVIAATLIDAANETLSAWVGRFEQDGTELWSATVGDGSASGVVVTDAGRLFATGFVSNYYSSVGPTWIAELNL